MLSVMEIPYSVSFTCGYGLPVSPCLPLYFQDTSPVPAHGGVLTIYYLTLDYHIHIDKKHQICGTQDRA